MHISKITTLMAMFAIGALAQLRGPNDGQVVDPDRQAPHVGSHAAMAGVSHPYKVPVERYSNESSV